MYAIGVFFLVDFFYEKKEETLQKKKKVGVARLQPTLISLDYSKL
jgi:hypothetical protein